MTSTNCVWKVKHFQQNQEGDWTDIGVGYLEFEADSISVISEDDPSKTILLYKVSNEVYHKQGDTILTWTSASGQTLALSFTDKSSLFQCCAEICAIQGRSVEELESEEELSEVPSLPSPNTQNLIDVLYMLSYYPVQRLVAGIIDSNFLSQLGSVLDDLSLDEKEKLEMVFMIYKILGNLHLACAQSKEILEILVSDQEFDKVLRGLARDPMLNGIVYNLKDLYLKSRFNDLMRVQSEVRKIIEKCNRVTFIKDIALGRHVDEQTSAFLLVYIQELWKDILHRMLCDESGFDELVKGIRKKDETGMRCLYEVCVMSKSLGQVDRLKLFKIFLKAGLIDFSEDLEVSDKKDRISECLAEYLHNLIETDPDILKFLICQEYPEFLTDLSKTFTSCQSLGCIQELSKLLKSLLSPDFVYSPLTLPIFTSSISPIFLSSFASLSTDHRSEVLSIFSTCLSSKNQNIIKIFTTSQFISDLKLLATGHKSFSINVLRFIGLLSSLEDRQLDLVLVRSGIIDFLTSALDCNFKSENLIFSVALNVIENLDKASSLVLNHLKSTFFKRLTEMKLTRVVKKLQEDLIHAQENESL